MSSAPGGGKQRVLQQVMERAAVDREFRQRLLTDPRGAIRAAFGLEVPADLKVKFIEKGADVDTLVVLPDLRRPEGELTDADLDAVAGGQGHARPRRVW